MAFWLRYTVIFAIIFATSAIYNCYLLSNKVILLLDSSHYLITTQHLHAFCLQASSGHIAQAWSALCAPATAADIMIDGPILPALGTLGFILSGLQPLATNWPALAMMLSACLGIMGCCVGITVENCKRPSKYLAMAGCLTSLLAGIGPEGLIAGSRFLTELPSATILALISALSSTVFFRRIGPISTSIIYFALPFLSICGFLLKPALALAYFLLPAFVLIRAIYIDRQKKVAGIIALMLCGLCTVLAPWCIYTMQATGQIHLSPERMPLFNLAKGNDLAVDAYSSNPSSISSEKLEQLDSISKILTKTWNEAPLDLAALYLRKLQRIVVTPWNDFLQTPYGIPDSVTRLLHYYVLLSAAAGIPAAIFGSIDRRTRIFQILLAAIIASTLILYLPFEGICRYGYPLQPVLLVFCASWHLFINKYKFRQSVGWFTSASAFCAIVNATYSMAKNCNYPLAVMVTLLAAVYMFIAFAWLHITSKLVLHKLSTQNKKLFYALAAFTIFGITTACITDPDLYQFVSAVSDKEERSLAENQTISANEQASENLLIINARLNPEKTKVRVQNGAAQINLDLIRLHMLDPKTAELANLNRIYSEIHDCPATDFFNWYACVIPKGIGHSPLKPINISISNCDLIYSRDKHSPHLSDWRYFSSGKLCNTPLSKDSRLVTSLPATTQLSPMQEKNSALDSQPQVFIMQIPASNAQSQLMLADIPLSLDNFDPIFRSSQKPDCLIIDKTRLKMTRRVAATVKLKQIPKNQRFMTVRLKGAFRTLGRDGAMGVLITLNDEQSGRSVVMPYCPSGLKANSTERLFAINGLINLAAIKFIPTSISVALFPREWPQYTLYGPDRFCRAFEVRDLKLQISDPGLPLIDLSEALRQQREY